MNGVYCPRQCDKPRYLATTSDLLKKAQEITKGTKVGVMSPTGRIAKRAGGGGKK